MSRFTKVSALVAGTVMMMGASAFAADMPLKAVKAPAIEPLDIHGFADITLTNGRVTPGGSVVYPGNRGLVTQAEVGLAIDVYKDKMGFINKVTLNGGVWNEWWSTPVPGGRSWSEMDYWLGASVGFAQNWNLSYTYLTFNIPNGPSAQNHVFTLSYSDSGFGILPFSINPYVTYFRQTGNFNLVGIGGTNVSRYQIGITPTLPLMKLTGLPLTITIPTWIMLADSKYWNAGVPAQQICGPVGAFSPCSTNALGVFSTGLQAKYLLTAFVPKRYGEWYIGAGVQYYHLYNNSLLASQVGFNGIATTFGGAKRDLAVVSSTIGFSF